MRHSIHIRYRHSKVNLYYADIDLTALIPNLDKVASDLVTQQRDALVERKDLAQRTKDFRKLDDATKLNEVKNLLKGSGK